MNSILIIGATSAIAEALARQLVTGSRFFLIGRHKDRLETIASDLKIRGAASVNTRVLDLLRYEEIPKALMEGKVVLRKIDLAVIAQGYLGDQETGESSFNEAEMILDTCYKSPVACLLSLAPILENQKYGTIAVMGSVAGDRGKKSNFIYGSAKSGLATFVAGMRNRLYASGVRVITIKPGFTDSPMTAHFKKGPLWSTPETVARSILKGINKNRDVIYAPEFWYWIMALIRSVPEFLFKRLNL